jgi:hypothetical protein
MLEPAPRRLSAIVLLVPGTAELRMTRVPLAEAPQYLPRLYYRPYLSRGLPAARLHGHFLKTLRTAPLFVTHRPNDLSSVHDLAAFVEGFAATLPTHGMSSMPSRATLPV